MSTITVKTEKESTRLCGFCSFGNRHDLCPGGILNGNRTEVYLCGCTEHDLVVRCLECNNRTPGAVSRETWTCTDAEACHQVRDRHRREIDERLFGGRTPAKLSEAREQAPKAPAKPKTNKCLCCGETTGGGLFRPGHDSKYLTRAVQAVKGGESLDDTMTAWARQGISEALQAKLVKRLGAA